MRLTSLAVAGFRNIETLRIAPGPRFNVLHGLNGQGKTNFLEAVYLLGNPRSFRHARLPELIRHGSPFSHVQGEVESSGTRNSIKLTLESGGRRVEINGKGIHRASELHGQLNVVVFSPDESGMVKLGPEARRRYLDRVVYAGDIGYLTCWHGYHRILKQRNQLLKCGEKEGLDVWTEKLAEAGAEVIERRHLFIERLNVTFQEYYSAIAKDETAQIGYQPEGIASRDRRQIFEELLNRLHQHQNSDERYGTTSVGPHRDDLQFFLNGRSLKAFGSQGQQKSFVLALKMAEMDNLETIFGESPLLLLDDMSSELDARRSANLMEFLAGRSTQVFITTTEKTTTLTGAMSDCAVFTVTEGNLTLEGTGTI